MKSVSRCKQLVSSLVLAAALGGGGLVLIPIEAAQAEHRTNKHDLRRSLEDGYVVLYSTEFSHAEMLTLSAALAGDIFGGSGSITSAYLTDLGRRAIRDMISEATQKAPNLANLIEQNLTLDNFLRSAQASFDGRRITLSLGGIETDFGRATYNRAECELGICIPTPNTYQLYMRIKNSDVDGAQDQALRDSNPRLPDSYLTAPVFAPDFYLLSYGDLRDAFGHNNPNAARQHWSEFGLSESRRSSPAFDVKYYRDIHSDLVNVFGEDYYGVVDHWLRHGISEGRRSSIVFDVKFYLDKYPDLQQAFGSTNYASAVDHWLRHGISEGRQGSSEFDPSFYLTNNPDVASVYGANNYMGAIAHYMEFGIREGRRGTP